MVRHPSGGEASEVERVQNGAVEMQFGDFAAVGEEDALRGGIVGEALTGAVDEVGGDAGHALVPNRAALAVMDLHVAVGVGGGHVGEDVAGWIAGHTRDIDDWIDDARGGDNSGREGLPSSWIAAGSIKGDGAVLVGGLRRKAHQDQLVHLRGVGESRVGADRIKAVPPVIFNEASGGLACVEAAIVAQDVVGLGGCCEAADRGLRPNRGTEEAKQVQEN